MQHRVPVLNIRRARLFPASLLAWVAACGCDWASHPSQSTPGASGAFSGSDSVPNVDVESAAPAPAELPSAAPAAEPPLAVAAMGSCSGALAACAAASTAPCTLHCATRADGCEVSAEFVPLGTISSGYSFRFGPIDPAGQWVFYSRDWNGGAFDTTPYRWSADEGVVSLSAALGVPPASEMYQSLTVRQVAAGGAAILLHRFETSDPIEAYLWTRDAGLTALDFDPTSMSADGRVVAGMKGLDPVIWDRERGTRALEANALSFSVTGVNLSNTGELALVAALDGRGFRWSEAQGLVPFEALAGFPSGARGTLAEPNGPVLWLYTGDFAGPEPQRVWRWSEADGARAIGTLPTLPPDTSYEASRSLADGTVLIGTAHAAMGLGAVVFRWSSELGMQQVTHASDENVYYANPDGTTLIGYVGSHGTLTGSFRWTLQGGLSAVPGDVRGGIAWGGDLLISRVWDGTKAETRVLKYGRALESGGALPIDIILDGLLPEGYELEFLEATSDDGRLLAGTARSADGATHGWLVRVHDSCNP